HPHLTAFPTRRSSDLGFHAPAVSLPTSLTPATPADEESVDFAPEETEPLDRGKTHATPGADGSPLRRRHVSFDWRDPRVRHGGRSRRFGDCRRRCGGTIDPVYRPLGFENLRILRVDP